MAEGEYTTFRKCRETKFFSKGFKPVLNWLGIRRDGTELQLRKVLEAFGYIMRYIVQRIVLQAVKLDSADKATLTPVTVPISSASYKRASEIIGAEIQSKCDEWRNQIAAF